MIGCREKKLESRPRPVTLPPPLSMQKAAQGGRLPWAATFLEPARRYTVTYFAPAVLQMGHFAGGVPNSMWPHTGQR